MAELGGDVKRHPNSEGNCSEDAIGIQDQALYGTFLSPPEEDPRVGGASPLEELGVDPNSLPLSKKSTELVLRPIATPSATVRYFSRIGPGSLRGSIFTLSSSAIGAGVLSLPYVLRDTGLVLGMVLFLLGAGLALLSMSFLIDTASFIMFESNMAGKVRSMSYSQLVGRVLGEKCSVLLEVILVVYCFGTCTGYIIVISKAIESICQTFAIALPSENFPMVLTALVALPLACFRDLSSLAMSSLFAVCSMLYVSFAITLRGVQNGQLYSGETRLINVDSGFFSSMSLIFFAYNCHSNIFSIYGALEYPLASRMKKVALRSVLLQVVMYSCVAVSGYLIYHEDTEGNILNNFPPSDIVITVGKVAVACALTACLPLYLHPTRENLYRLLAKCLLQRKNDGACNDESTGLENLSLMAEKEDADPGREDEGTQNKQEEQEGESTISTARMPRRASLPVHVVLTVSILGGALYLAMNVPGIAIVFSFLGATCALMISFVFPFLMYHSVVARMQPIPELHWRVRIKQVALLVVLSLICFTGIASVCTMAYQLAYV